MFDVFLSYNSQDKAAVEAIATRLRGEAGVEPFLDKWHLIPGERWQPALEEALEASKAVAVFIGPSGVSPWHNEEIRAALANAVRMRDEYRVIPVLLPGADEKAVTGFLAQRTWVDFRSGLDRDEPFQRLVTGVNGVPRASESFTLPDEPAPYRGLYRFEREHADRFFGRESEVDAVLRKLERSNFVALVGASGAGKSSLVMAGVLPKFERIKSWMGPITTFVLTPGANPLRALSERTVALLPPADRLRSASELEAEMLRRADGFRTALSNWVADRSGMTVLVVDQLEEVFTHAPEAGGLTEVEAFAANLRDVVENGSGEVKVIATVRADFFERCLRVEPLRALLQDRDVLLGPMTAAGLRDAIVRPAAAVGAYFESGVVGALMKELKHRVVVLPLLEHALDLLWRARKSVWLTFEAYEAMGGVAGALKKHADACWGRFTETEQAVARDILLRLVSLG
ncbi:MAG TPA: toll/interleukin-1 receptor domain-containing protein, partial [Myxococcales bacterium]|nr:toll/interleukin-1 receptor domain-containing protein [Myxococcales bacterium]